MSVMGEEEMFGSDVACVELTAENERLLNDDEELDQDELHLDVAPEDRFVEETQNGNQVDNDHSDVMATRNDTVNVSMNDTPAIRRIGECGSSSNFGGRISLRAHRGRMQRARPYSRKEHVVAGQKRGQDQDGEQTRRPVPQMRYEVRQSGQNGLENIDHDAKTTESAEVIEIDEDEIQVVEEVSRVSRPDQILKKEECAENYAYNNVTEDEVAYLGEKNFEDSDAVLAVVQKHDDLKEMDDVETIDVDDDPVTTSSSDCDDEVVVIGGTFDQVGNLLIPKLENMELREDRLSDGTKVLILKEVEVEATQLNMNDRIQQNLAQNFREMDSRPSRDNPKLFRGRMEDFKRKLFRLARKGRILCLHSGAPCLDLRDLVEEKRKERESKLKAVGFTNPAKWGRKILHDKCRAYGKLLQLAFDEDTFEAIAYFEDSKSAKSCFNAFNNRDVGVKEPMKARLFSGTPQI